MGFIRVIKWCVKNTKIISKLAIWSKIPARSAEIFTYTTLTLLGVPMHYQYPIIWTSVAVMEKAVLML